MPTSLLQNAVAFTECWTTDTHAPQTAEGAVAVAPWQAMYTLVMTMVVVDGVLLGLVMLMVWTRRSLAAARAAAACGAILALCMLYTTGGCWIRPEEVGSVHSLWHIWGQSLHCRAYTRRLAWGPASPCQEQGLWQLSQPGCKFVGDLGFQQHYVDSWVAVFTLDCSIFPGRNLSRCHCDILADGSNKLTSGHSAPGNSVSRCSPS